MKIAFFGSSLLSAYWNGAATYYRGILAALHARGHAITFYEPDAFERQQHRDIDPPEYAAVVVYPAGSPDDALNALDQARHADVIVKASGVGVYDALLESAVLSLKTPHNLIAFWDVDAPATLDRVQADAADPFRALIPRYDVILTYGGGGLVETTYKRLGARLVVPIYNAVDPATHHPVAPDPAFAVDLAFIGNRLPDREARVENFFLGAAALMPGATFLLGGSGWGDKPMPANVRYIGHVYTRDHNAINGSARAVLNINRDSMAAYGFSPPTRVFEVAGAGGCLISDAWMGIETFLTPGDEMLTAAHGGEVAALLAGLSPDRARAIGAAARRRVLAEHTYAHRAAQVEIALEGMAALRLAGGR
ncbi:MAG: glycosyltransferase [bacterium]|nr:glycosyltransferase [bacterium]